MYLSSILMLFNFKLWFCAVNYLHIYRYKFLVFYTKKKNKKNLSGTEKTYCDNIKKHESDI